MVRQGGISGRLVRSPEYVFDLGTTVARGWKIFPFVDYFISDCVGQAKRLVTAAAQQVLDLFQQYSWPGNIRELRNVVKRQYGSLKDVPYCSGGL